MHFSCLNRVYIVYMVRISVHTVYDETMQIYILKSLGHLKFTKLDGFSEMETRLTRC